MGAQQWKEGKIYGERGVGRLLRLEELRPESEARVGRQVPSLGRREGWCRAKDPEDIQGHVNRFL